MARLLLATLALLAGLARAAHFKTECLYFSHQHQHEVMIYRPDASRAPPSHPYGKIYPEPNPTGLAYYKGDVLVAAYGNLGTIKPSIRRYTAATRLPRGYFANGPEVHECFPEGLAVYDPVLVVGCGGGGANSVIKYNLTTGAYLGALATGLPAVFGVTVKDDYVYFASHCTADLVGGQPWCTKEAHDKVFRVPITGGPGDVTAFASWPDDRPLGFTGLRFGPDGNLYVASKVDWDVYSFGPLGNPLRKLNLRRPERASDIVFGPNGLVRAFGRWDSWEQTVSGGSLRGSLRKGAVGFYDALARPRPTSRARASGRLTSSPSTTTSRSRTFASPGRTSSTPRSRT